MVSVEAKTKATSMVRFPFSVYQVLGSLTETCFAQQNILVGTRNEADKSLQDSLKSSPSSQPLKSLGSFFARSANSATIRKEMQRFCRLISFGKSQKD